MEQQSARKARIGPSHSVGGFCRIKSEDDFLECTIRNLANNQATLEIVGYKTELKMPASQLLPSSGSKAREKQEQEANLANPKTDWKKGDYCRAQWKEDRGGDDVIYESVINSVGNVEGYDYAEVEFLGYGNRESAFFHDILPSLGPESRKQQVIYFIFYTK